MSSEWTHRNWTGVLAKRPPRNKLAFLRRSIPARCVARRSHTPGMLAPRAFYAGRLDAGRRSVYFPPVAKGLMVATLLLGLLAPVSAVAQGRAARSGPRVIQLEEIHIEGRVQKPNAFYILNRSNIGYEVMDLRTSFVRDIVRTVQRAPF